MKGKTSDVKDAIELLKNDHDKVKDSFKRFEGLGDRAFVAKKKLASEICSDLTRHSILEQEFLYPAFYKEFKENRSLVNEALVEHMCTEALITQIQNTESEDELFDAKVKVLSEYVNHHIKEEETEMFPKLKKSTIDLSMLGKEMAARKSRLTSENM